jgi:hypothetical protein
MGSARERRHLELARRGLGYVLAVAKSHPVTTGIGARPAIEQARRLPARAWQRLSARSAGCSPDGASNLPRPHCNCTGPGGDAATRPPPAPATAGDKPAHPHDHEVPLDR